MILSILCLGLLQQVAVVARLAVDCDLSPDSNEPQAVHLAFAGNPSSSIAVSFLTCGSGGVPQAQILDESGNVAQTFSGTTSKYYKRHHHDIILSSLSPGSSYKYKVGLAGESSSPTFSFRTAPQSQVDEQMQTFTAAVIGDMGVNNSAATVSRLTERASHLNFTIHLGDVGYADDYHLPLHIEPSSGRSYESVYDLFQHSIEPIASAMPYMVMVGNHDVSCAVTGDLGCPKEQRNFSAYRYRFRMPSMESGASRSLHHNMWYSWQVGGVHFVSLSSESDFPGAPTTPHTFLGGGAGGGFGDQLGWLRRDLAAARANPSVQWIVAMGHRPWYASKSSDWPLWAPHYVQKAFEPLLYEFGVDIYLCAHKHYYERAQAAFQGKPDETRGIVQIVNGAAGNNEGIDKGKGAGSGLIVAANYESQGFGELSVLNSTAMRWRYYQSSDGSVSDELILFARDRHVWEESQTSTYV